MKDDTKQLLLDEFRNNQCKTYSSTEDYLFDDNPTKEYEPSDLFKKIYANAPDDYRLIFATAHERLNDLFGFLNSRAASQNRHYTANKSRELASLIRDLFCLRNELSFIGIFMIIDADYEKKMNESLTFLKESYGSEIPESVHYFEVKRLRPIFYIKDEIAEKRMTATIVPFSSEYQKKQASKMLSMINTDTVKAIGAAKEYIETCLQGILINNTDKDVDKMTMPQLLSEVRDYFGLNESKLKEVKAIISGLSQIVNGISELRNHKGSGHSHTSKIPKPTATEARLAVDAAITIVNFFSGLYSKK